MSSKPYEISKWEVWNAYLRVKAKGGAAGVDGQTIQAFEKNLKTNLFKLWNRMSSGSYFPSAVKRVDIPKSDGATRPLGVPTVVDRIAQTVVKMRLEPQLEQVFQPNSYGYRPGRSAHQAIAQVRERCWRQDWVLDVDIKGFFDNLDHTLMMAAVRKHTKSPWMLLYIERWLKSSVQLPNGQLEERSKGTPQGGVISPLLANLFLHYAFDAWMGRTFPTVPFERYADDIVVHCTTQAEAEHYLTALTLRLSECGLELHPEKTRVVYCKDDRRRGDFPNTSFDFLGYTFRPRKTQARNGSLFVGFTPAMARKAQTRIFAEIRKWKLHRRTTGTLNELAQFMNPIVRGWIAYYGKFRPSAMSRVFFQLNARLRRWAMKKFTRRCRSYRRAWEWLKRIMRSTPTLFVHWNLLPSKG